MVGTVGNNLGIGAFVTKVDLVGAALIFVVWTCNYSRFPGRRTHHAGLRSTKMACLLLGKYLVHSRGGPTDLTSNNRTSFNIPFTLISRC